MPERDGDGQGGMSSVEKSERLTNDDFRKLMMTPRVGGFGSSQQASLGAPASTGRPGAGATAGRKPSQVKSDLRKNKKSEYLKEKKEEEEILAELAKKYRDRAKERRDGGETSGPDAMTTLGAYRAVAPDIKTTMDAAERRKQMIQESKFLGGDMEHTHLVKGLDYALLQKVRSEIEQQEEEEDEQLEQAVDDVKIAKESKEHKDKDLKKDDDEIVFKTILGKNIYRAVFQSAPPERNEHFLPGRMAYQIELEDEMAETDDIPTTVLRSKADCPGQDSQATLSTNDIVINKLTQILSYLRQGGKNKKMKRQAKDRQATAEAPTGAAVQPLSKLGGTAALRTHLAKPVEEDSIYGNIGDYVPTTLAKTAQGADKNQRNYFDQDATSRAKDKSSAVLEAERTLGALLKPGAGPDPLAKKREKKADTILSKLSAQPEGYAECYPGFEEMNDALEDSDDEADYTKMDAGNKKGPVGRWDFDTAEEYGDYMNKKEALPKAAFQYGVKMADGRKTRRIGVKTEKSERAELDREWQKIQSIMHKRKAPSSAPSGAPSAPSDSPAPEKVARR